MDGIFCCTALKKSDKIDKWLKADNTNSRIRNWKKSKQEKRPPYDQ
jgi:hypothetical protein